MTLRVAGASGNAGTALLRRLRAGGGHRIGGLLRGRLPGTGNPY
ncbi:hypothetical protein [Dactylosporangium sp. NPDC049140]|jgi:nucleoside-diphosphate-sugar epimerase